jgi:hypothetical protein
MRAGLGGAGVYIGELVYALGEWVQGQRETSRAGLEQAPMALGVLFESYDGSVFFLPPVEGEKFPPLASGAIVPRAKVKVVQYPHLVVALLTPDDAARLAGALLTWSQAANEERDLFPMRSTRRARRGGR